MRYTIPTILTLIRIGLIPVFVLIFYLAFEGSNIVITAVFGIAAVTDWLDGYLARKMGETSAFGAFLDPVADKLMVIAALTLLIESHQSFWFTMPAMIIIGREITISALREWMAVIGEQAKVAVSYIGKIKTTAQMIALLLLLYRENLWILQTEIVGYIFLYIAAILTIWSMLVYLQAAWPIISREDSK